MKDMPKGRNQQKMKRKMMQRKKQTMCSKWKIGKKKEKKDENTNERKTGSKKKIENEK